MSLDEMVSVPVKVLAKLERAAYPGYSCCGRCRRPWKTVEGHSTMYREDRGCFPLCEGCWGSLTPKERLPYYRDLMGVWRRDGTYDRGTWRQVRAAVLAGK